jgi:hypothetical protein
LLLTFSTLIFEAETPMRILTVLYVQLSLQKPPDNVWLRQEIEKLDGCTQCPCGSRSCRPTTAHQGGSSSQLTMADRCPLQSPPPGAAAWPACSSSSGPRLGVGSQWVHSLHASHLQLDCRKQQGHQQHGSLCEQPCAAATLGRLVYGARSIQVKPGRSRVLRHGARSDALINDFGCYLCTCES